MAEMKQKIVGPIAERIVQSELEYHGFKTVDLNAATGISENADIIAVRNGNIWQIQVKATTHPEDNDFWNFQYGFCNPEVIDKKQSVFNRVDGFYKANVVVLLSIRKPSQYKSIIIPVDLAEQAAQLNLDGYYRKLNKKGEKRKPHKMWIVLNPPPGEKEDDCKKNQREILQPYVDDWEKAFSQNT